MPSHYPCILPVCELYHLLLRVTSFSNVNNPFLIKDTAGAERYQAMSAMYYRSARAAILCYGL